MLSWIVSEKRKQGVFILSSIFFDPLAMLLVGVKAVKLGLELGLKIKVELTEKNPLCSKFFFSQAGPRVGCVFPIYMFGDFSISKEFFETV